MKTLTSEQESRKAYRVAEKQLKAGELAESLTLADGTQAKVGDVVEWFRVVTLGPDDGLLMVRAITRNGWIEGVFTRRSPFKTAVVWEQTVLVDAERLRQPMTEVAL
jgi:hypothetical protein